MTVPAAPEDAAGPSAAWRDLPLVDPSVLDDFGGQLEDGVAVRGFVADFIDIWPRRYSRLVTSLETHDHAALLDAVLSLKVASMMVGAPQLAHLSVELEATIRAVNLDAARIILNVLEQSGMQTVQKLQGV